MSLVFVFSGTSEGRQLCEKLAERNVDCFVFVATEYGSAVMEKNANIQIQVGRLESDDIAKLIKSNNPDYIIDATHPHAEIITDNILKACESSGVSDKYIRLSRNTENNGDIPAEYSDTIINVFSNEEAVLKLKELSDGNTKIMLTTGVKELKYFCVPDIKDKLIVRVLPSIESLSEVYECKIPTKSVIAMEGPFSKAMNMSLIDNYQATILVTKNSGSRGGFIEKIAACKERGIKAIVINKDSSEEDGKSMSEVVSIVCKNSKKHISLIGAGVCDEDYITIKAKNAIKTADVIIGAKRMAEFAKSINSSAKVFCEYKPEKVAEIINDCNASEIAILFSGDTGLCSGMKNVYEYLTCNQSENGCLDIEVIPGISSISYFASKLRLQYSDYNFYNFHGKEDGISDSLLQNFDKGFFAICSGVNDVKTIVHSIHSKEKFNNKNINNKNINNKKSSNEEVVEIFIGKNLGSEDEEIIKIVEDSQVESLNEALYVIAVIKQMS